jgi:hypothetical protein
MIKKVLNFQMENCIRDSFLMADYKNVITVPYKRGIRGWVLSPLESTTYKHLRLSYSHLYETSRMQPRCQVRPNIVTSTPAKRPLPVGGREWGTKKK